jgi:hypothetical protein
MQDNPIDRVKEVMRSQKWSNHEIEVVAYLLKLKEFDANELEHFISSRRILGVTKDQIRRWAELFDVVDGDTVRTPRPTWAKNLRSFSDFEPDQRQLVTWFAKDAEGKNTDQVHPEITKRNLAGVAGELRGSILRDINRERLRGMFGDHASA